MERSPLPARLDPSLLRRGEITIAIAAVIVLLGLVALPWYVASHPHFQGGGLGGTAPAEFGAWTGAGVGGTFLDLVILFAALGAIGVVVAGARGIELDGSGRRLLVASAAAVVAVLLRIAVTPDAVSGYSFDSGLRFGIFWTLIGTLAMAWGAAMRAQRTVRGGRDAAAEATTSSARSRGAESRSSPRRSA